MTSSPGPRLTIELVPEPLWGKSLATTLPRPEWRRLRQFALDRAGNACEVCALAVAGGKHLVCRERWFYDDDSRLQLLTGVRIQCRDCDAVTHIGRIDARAGRDAVRAAMEHMARANAWTPAQVMAAVAAAKGEWVRRSALAWTQDTGWYDRWRSTTL